MWKSININKQNVKADTGSAMLIACPHNSSYDGWCFWHPAKLIRAGRHRNALSLSYTEEFEFTLKKYKKNSYEVIDEDCIDYEEFEIMFGVMDDKITAPNNDFETHKPGQLEAENVEVLAELKDE